MKHMKNSKFYANYTIKQLIGPKFLAGMFQINSHNHDMI